MSNATLNLFAEHTSLYCWLIASFSSREKKTNREKKTSKQKLYINTYLFHSDTLYRMTSVIRNYFRLLLGLMLLVLPVMVYFPYKTQIVLN